jgi:hypothetical protein
MFDRNEQQVIEAIEAVRAREARVEASIKATLEAHEQAMKAAMRVFNDMSAMLHKGEAVLPPPQTEALNRALSGSKIRIAKEVNRAS